jgi:2-oxoglutarate dehydrogenase E1 component
MPLLIHGDAAFMGQGVVAETLNLSQLEGYTTGGTIHLVVNNQIGFTTQPRDSRSTRYCTDIARCCKRPRLPRERRGPRGGHPGHAPRIEFRQRFKQDVVIDMYCYRKYGHNEGDEPRFTQPQMYALIDKKPTVREVYVQAPRGRGHISREEADSIAHRAPRPLSSARSKRRAGRLPPEAPTPWAGSGLRTRRPDSAVPEVATELSEGKAPRDARQADPDARGVSREPEGAEDPRAAARARGPGSRSTGDRRALAFATILLDGHGIRLSGQDARRGTFSHRHASSSTPRRASPTRRSPTSATTDGVGRFEIYDSPLSEAGVLGFEYGYSLDRPRARDLGGAVRRLRQRRAGHHRPVHRPRPRTSGCASPASCCSCRTATRGRGPSTRARASSASAARRRRQHPGLQPHDAGAVLPRAAAAGAAPWRKPLVVFTPKSLLRSHDAMSTLDDIATARSSASSPTTWSRPATKKRILLCSGKVYYDLARRAKTPKRDDVAIVRLEQYYPLSEAICRTRSLPTRTGTPCRLGSRRAAQHGRLVLHQRAAERGRR